MLPRHTDTARDGKRMNGKTQTVSRRRVPRGSLHLIGGRAMQGRRFRNSLVFSAVILLCALLTVSVFAAAGNSAPETAGATARRTVRVGLPDTDTVAASGGENRAVAFDKDYLQAVAEYANWNYEYVPASWADCLEMLKTGEIDVLLDVSKTDERLAWFDYSSESMGTELCCLYGRSDTQLQYNNFEQFNGMTVGYEQGSTILDSLREYGAERGFTFKTRAYSSGAAMFAALDAGEIDTVAQANFYDTPAGHVILAKCCPSPIYIASAKKDHSLKVELDEAMAQLFSYNAGFNADLYKYHFGSTASKSVVYTRKELDYLATHPVVDVYYETNWEPFEYARNGIAAGITPDVIRAIGKDTGITFRFVLSSSTQAVYENVGGASKDTVMAVSYDYIWANNHDLLVTQPYVSGSTMRVMKKAGTEPKTVAVVKDGYLADQIRKTYPNLKPVDYLTFGECMDAVEKGKADCVFLNYYQASAYRSMSTYAILSYQPDENITQSISLGVTKESNPALFGILSKSIQRLSTGTLQGILNEDSAKSEPLSFALLMRRYPTKMALGLAMIGLLVGLLIVLLVTANQRKQRNEQLAAAKLEADAANEAKTDFLSRMSHDMRTPLNGIIGMTYLTDRMELPEEARGNLRKIDTSSRFLLSLINDVLDMSKAESGKIELHPEPYTSQEFDQYIDAVIRPLCKEKNQQLITDIVMPPDRVPLMDKLRTNQIVFNLLSNAVKYTPEGGEIRFSAVSEVLPGDRLAMKIVAADNGIGMSEKFQKMIFDPFTQEGRNDNSEVRGSGLGLAITKRLVDLMGGTIGVESEIGKGSSFTVNLELDSERADRVTGECAESAAAQPGSLLAGKHILLCEDHPLNQEIARALLEEKGMLVEMAEDGASGVEMFSHSSVDYYDAILMDIRMPVMDGYEATRQIRALDRADAKTVPIIAMTADAFADDVQKCLDTGMNGHIAKPIDPETLYGTLEKLARG